MTRVEKFESLSAIPTQVDEELEEAIEDCCEVIIDSEMKDDVEEEDADIVDEDCCIEDVD